MKRLPLAAALLAAGILLGGCGGSGGEGNAGGAPTKAEYIAHGDKICSRTVKGVSGAFRAFLFTKGLVTPAEMSPAQRDELIRTIGVPALREMVGKLGRLELPKGEEEEAEEVVAAFEENVAGLEADPNANERLEYAQNEKAKEFGFEVCGQR